MRSVVAFAGAIALVTAGSAAAQEFKPPPLFADQTRPAPKPPKVDWNWRPPVHTQTASPAVICGMTVVPADPKTDPKMAVKPKDTRTNYTLKVAEPTVCKAPHR